MIMNLKVEEVLLHEAAGGLGRRVVIDQGGVLGRLVLERVLTEARLAHKEVGHVLRGQHGVSTVVDRLVGDALRVLAIPACLQKGKGNSVGKRRKEETRWPNPITPQ